MVNLSPRQSAEFATESLRAVAHALGDAEGETEAREVLAVKCSELIDRLLQTASTPGGRAKPGLLDPRLLKEARALQFVFTEKTGLLLGRAATQGVSLVRLGAREDGSPLWSAPCFLTSDSISLGITLGAHQLATLCCVLTEHAAAQLQSHGVLIGAAGEKHLTIAKAVHAAAALDAAAPLPDVVTAYHSEGLLLDLPLFKAGALEVDVQMNSKVYGPEALQGGPLAILNGSLPCPSEYIILHKTLIDAILNQQ